MTLQIITEKLNHLACEGENIGGLLSGELSGVRIIEMYELEEGTTKIGAQTVSVCDSAASTE